VKNCFACGRLAEANFRPTVLRYERSDLWHVIFSDELANFFPFFTCERWDWGWSWGWSWGRGRGRVWVVVVHGAVEGV
jgi:hypothetical protein